MPVKRMPLCGPPEAIQGVDSGDTYPTYAVRLEGILDPLQDISIARLDPPMMLQFDLKK